MRYERTALIKAREGLGLDRAQFAKRVGLHRAYVYKVEKGWCDASLPTMQRWIAQLGPGATLDLFRTAQMGPAYKIRA